MLEEGQESAGPAMVWDEGTYISEREIGNEVLEAVTERAEAEALMQAWAGCRNAGRGGFP